MIASEIVVSEYLAVNIGESEAALLRREAIALLNSNVMALQNTFDEVFVDLEDESATPAADAGYFQINLVIRGLNKQIVLRSADERLVTSLAHGLQAQISAHILSLNHLAKMRQAKREWEVLADLLNHEFYLVDGQFTIHRLNRAAASALSDAPRELVGHAFPHEFVGGETTLRSALPATSNESRIFTVSIDDDYFQVEVFKINWGFDRTGFIFIRTLITEDIRSQRLQLGNARLAGLGQVAMGLAHELNNPLGVILAAVGTLQRRYGDDARLQRYIHIINSEVERCRRITHALLDYGRTPHRNGTFLSLQSVLADIPTRMKATFPECDITVKLNRCGYVFGNEDDLVRLFSNLTANAIEASDQAHPVHIVLADQGGHSTVTISNSGPEIAANVAQKMFDPFFTTKPQGTGLGLAFAKKICEMMQGNLWHSREQGCNQFHVRFPSVSV